MKLHEKIRRISVTEASKLADQFCHICQEEITNAKAHGRQHLYRPAAIGGSAGWHVFATSKEAVRSFYRNR